MGIGGFRPADPFTQRLEPDQVPATMPILMSQLFFVTVMIWAAVSDLTTMTIPNKIILVLLAGFLLLALATDLPMIQSVAGGLIALVISFILFSFGWIGGGDAKLVAVNGLWIGIDQLGQFLITTSIFGAVLTLVILLFRAIALRPAVANLNWISRLHQHGGGVPYGIAIAGAGCSVLIGPF